jgi:hypothetical protein
VAGVEAAAAANHKTSDLRFGKGAGTGTDGHGRARTYDGTIRTAGEAEGVVWGEAGQIFSILVRRGATHRPGIDARAEGTDRQDAGNFFRAEPLLRRLLIVGE